MDVEGLVAVSFPCASEPNKKPHYELQHPTTNLQSQASEGGMDRTEVLGRKTAAWERREVYRLD